MNNGPRLDVPAINDITDQTVTRKLDILWYLAPKRLGSLDSWTYTWWLVMDGVVLCNDKDGRRLRAYFARIVQHRIARAYR